ncbi:TIGR02206 family membrane protein [Helcococcus ovis]|uniref:YwaF family protein n=1 Tax=Helcococcus ovis TaxID=72026 RepID=UPI00106FB2BF|nr:TIGR02206 family membrane protein [Helcococcus ovis]TFF68859.1 TIGR02206 family membrane protein [Helcococcus ovis]WNZ00712.1 TIGR02206 family membrane protein [Helcococcus ovis]
MNFIKYFFRNNLDNNSFGLLSTFHLSAIIILILLTIFVISFKNKDRKKQENLLKLMGILLLSDKIMMFIWMVTSGFYTLEASLPVYNCRIVAWFFIYDIFIGNKILRKIGIYWGLMGGILAILMPEPYAFRFPHYTNFQFFIFHYLIFLIAIYNIVVRKESLDKKDLLFTVKFTAIYNLCVMIFTLLLRNYYPKANYGFLVEAPNVVKNLMPLQGILYYIFVLLLYSLIMVVMHFVGKLFCKLAIDK